jgi:hypothetical protein
MATPPTAAEAREHLGIPTSVSDAVLGEIVAAEIDVQAARCRWVGQDGALGRDPAAYPQALRMAVFRRVARAVAARGLPLGFQAGEFGIAGLRGDDVLERLEGPYRRVVV